ncbi:MAG: DUF4148 domain-containing protein [Rhizobacter sp.]
MKLAHIAIAAMVLTTFTAAAQDRPGPTRAEVLRELAEARRMGDIIISGCGGGTQREAFPNRYPARDVAVAGPADAPGPRADNAGPSAKAEVAR